MDGGSWFWMSAMMVFWLAALLALIYVVVKLAGRAAPDHSREARP
jgi:flagellar biogenesis protein FliO